MIAIIIVGYNSKNYLADCILSIKKSTYKDCKVIFVDNNSSDGSFKFVEKNYPEVLIIKNEQNYGFAKANNIGIKKTIQLGAKCVFLLNPDTVIDENCLQNLINKTDKNTILQPIILMHKNGKKTNLINTDGGVLNYLGFSYCGNYLKKYQNSKKSKDITVASGAAMLIPIKILKSIGIFDENFFMYHEDVDFFWRARIAGFNIKLIPDAKVWHKYSFTRNKKKYFYTERNRLLFLAKNFEMKTLLLISPALLISELLVLIYTIRAGWFLMKLRSCSSVFFLLPHILRKRRVINKMRKKRDSDLKQLLTPTIGFSEINIPLLNVYDKIIEGYWHLIARKI